MLTRTHCTKVCGPHLIADWKSHYTHQIKWWLCLINMYYIITGTFCKWSHTSVYIHIFTCDGRQDSDYRYPVYHDFWSTCFNSVYCHYFGFLLTLLKICAGISHSVDCASWYTCVIKTNKMHFSFLIYFNNLSCTCFEQSDHHQEAVTVYAA